MTHPGAGERLPAVGVTGVGVAAIRAAESARGDRLFDDPFAARFVDAAAWPPPGRDHTVRPGLSAWIAVRTRFLDEVVLGACAQGCRQVVILGAGLDARAFRLPWPAGTRVWELDLAAVLDFKEDVVRSSGWTPTCRRAALRVDLTGSWGATLLEAGLRPDLPVTWLAEGLLVYLADDACNRMVRTAAELSMPGSRLGVTVASPERLASWRRANPERRARRKDYVALWRSTSPRDPVRWLASHGWRGRLYGPAERSSVYGREPTDVADEMLGAGLIDAIRG